MSDSPAVILYDSSGVELAVSNGVAIPVSTRALLASGRDSGDVARFMLVDSLGRPIVAGAGVAGIPAGGVLSVQGVTGGEPLSVSSVDLSAGLVGSPAPSYAQQIGAVNSAGNLESVTAYDVNSNGGLEYALGVSLRKSTMAGSVELGTDLNPIRTDTTGTTTQPVSDGGGSLTVDTAQLPAALVGGRLSVDVGMAALPIGAATEATLATRVADATITARLNTLGQKAMAASAPIVIASDQSQIPIVGSVNATVFDGPNSLDINASGQAAIQDPPNLDVALSTRAAEHVTAASPHAARLTDGAAFYKATTPFDTQPVSAVALPLPTGAATSANQTNGTQQTQITDGVNVAAVTATNLLRVDTSGTVANVVVVGLPEPVQVAGTDGFSVQELKTDTSGRLSVVGGQSHGFPATANPLLMAGIDGGGDIRRLLTAADGTVRIDPTGVTTQPVSGTVDIGLPGTLALDATLTSGAQKTQIVDGADTLDINASGQAAIQNPPNLDAAISTRAAEHVTAASPHAVRLTDGAAFYKATTPADTQPISAVSLPLPTGAATEATLSTRATEATLATRASEATLATRASEATLAAAAASVASIDTDFDVALSTRASEATLSTRATSANQTNGSQQTRITDGVDLANVTAAGRLEVDGSGVTQPVSITGQPIRVGGTDGISTGIELRTDAIGRQIVIGADANAAAALVAPFVVAGADTTGNVRRLEVSSQPIVSGHGLSVRPVVPSSASVTSIGASVVNQTLLVSNPFRQMARITNDGNSTLYVKLGITASSVSWTWKLLAGESTGWFVGTDRVDGIWAVANGSARITERS